MDHSSHMNTRKMGAYWSLAFQHVRNAAPCKGFFESR